MTQPAAGRFTTGSTMRHVVVMTLTDGFESSEKIEEAVSAVERLVAALEPPEGVDVTLGGLPFVRAVVVRNMEADQLKLLGRSVGPVDTVVADAGATGLRVFVEDSKVLPNMAGGSWTLSLSKRWDRRTCWLMDWVAPSLMRQRLSSFRNPVNTKSMCERKTGWRVGMHLVRPGSFNWLLAETHSITPSARRTKRGLGSPAAPWTSPTRRSHLHFET